MFEPEGGLRITSAVIAGARRGAKLANQVQNRTWFGSLRHVPHPALRLVGRQPNQIREFRTRAAHFETTSRFASLELQLGKMPLVDPDALLLYTTEAALYDIAFSWDTSDEVDWLLGRLGEGCAPVLEPACGSGRFLVGFARRGIEAVGVDVSSLMVRMAQERLQAERLPGGAVVADMTEFELGRVFGGAICPIDSLAYLDGREQLLRHLRCMAQHLRPSSRYLVQLELRDADDPWRGVQPSMWEQEQNGVRVRTHWRVEQIDLENGVELQRGTIECLAGPDEGRVFDEVHRMAAWTPARWAAAIAESPFRYVAVYDGNEEQRPLRPIGSSGRLLWHELVLDGP